MITAESHCKAQETIFGLYTANCNDFGAKACSVTVFFKLLKCLFKSERHSKRSKLFDNIKLQKFVECDSLVQCLRRHENCRVATKDANQWPIVVDFFCDEEVDERPVTKRIKFYQNYFELMVDGEKVDLGKVLIDCNMRSTQHHAIIRLVELLKVCQGVSTEEEATNMRMRHHGDHESYHAVNCPGVCSILGTATSCDTCRKVYNTAKEMNKARIRTSDSMPIIHVEETEDEEDEEIDYDTLIDDIFRDGSEELRHFIKQQRQALSGPRKWSPQVIGTCLNMYIRSPRSYKDLKDSNMVILPSGRQLRRYKNSIQQEQGPIDDMFVWMRQAADKAILPNYGYNGYLILDEMKVQEDLVLQRRQGKLVLVGFVELEGPLRNLEVWRKDTPQRELATNVLQYIFLGSTGFRFPIAHYPTSTAKASELYVYTHSIIRKLDLYGFEVTSVIMDGGAQNRDFIRMHFKEHPMHSSWLIKAPYNPMHSIALVQDFSHDMKKIRNSLLKSGTMSFHTRRIKVHGSYVFWYQLVKAVQWDRGNNLRPLSYKITDNHLYPNQSEKMRNHLAEQMLDADMLHIVRKYQETLTNKDSLKGLIALLEVTSKLVHVFRDEKPISSTSDDKLQAVKDCADFFRSWISAAESPHTKLSRECLDDILNLTVTFPIICTQFLTQYPGANFYAHRFNSDLVENNFCQARGLKNGNLTHPTYATYKGTINSIILGQTSVSSMRNSNASICRPDPYKAAVNKSTKL